MRNIFNPALSLLIILSSLDLPVLAQEATVSEQPAEAAQQPELVPEEAPALEESVVETEIASESEKETVTEEEAQAEEGIPTQEVALEDTLWVGGEVIGVDSSAGTISVSYYDFESDELNDIDIVVTGQTEFEGVNSLSGIESGDYVDVDYVVSPEGKNVARLIAVEKLDIYPEELETPQE
jgi:hypothetical protein